MNHLAHCLLSFGQGEVLVGNFMGDWVKGKQWQAYPLAMQRGLLLHRYIDAFTDGHARVRACVGLVRPYAGRYAGPMVDILFDYVLATHWDDFAEMPLDGFAAWAYQTLHTHAEWLPAKLQERLPKMIEGDFLAAYAHPEGLAFALERFALRVPDTINMPDLLDFFHAEQRAFVAAFEVFFPDMLAAARVFLER